MMMMRTPAWIAVMIVLNGCAHRSVVAESVDAPALVAIPGGTFDMGNTVDYGYGPMDGPRHAVTVAPFAIASHEVTRAQYARFVRETGYKAQPACNVYSEGNPEWHMDPSRSWENPGFPQADNHPVVCITWNDTQAYIGWLNRKSGKTYRLPSEAEWEYLAVKGGLGMPTHQTANMGREPCCGGRIEGRDIWMYTAPVGSYRADRFGLHDIRGNVWEWQGDCYHQDYEGAPLDGSARTTGCEFPAHSPVRGGSFGDAAYNYGPTFRLRGPKAEGYFTLGFRIASDAAPKPRRK